MGGSIKIQIYGQENNHNVHNLAKINMILNGILFDKFHIHHADNLLNPHKQHLNLNGKNYIVVANPEFGLKWEKPQTLLKDPSFISFGKLAPERCDYFVFVQHMLYLLEENYLYYYFAFGSVLYRKYRINILEKTYR